MTGGFDRSTPRSRALGAGVASGSRIRPSTTSPARRASRARRCRTSSTPRTRSTPTPGPGRGRDRRQGYRPNRPPVRSARARSALLGYCVPPTGTATPCSTASSTPSPRRPSAHSYHVLLFTETADVHPPMSAYRSLLAQRAVDGFVISDTTVGDERQEWLSRHEVPFAAFGRRWAAPEIGSWVDVDGAAGIAAAVDHVVAARPSAPRVPRLAGGLGRRRRPGPRVRRRGRRAMACPPTS